MRDWLYCRHCCGDLLARSPHKTTEQLQGLETAAKPEWELKPFVTSYAPVIESSAWVFCSCLLLGSHR